MATDRTHPEPLACVVRLFETLAPGDVPRLGDYYSDDARFKDPFNEVRGIEPIRQVFTHMFERLDAPRFEILDAIGDDRQAMLTWDFRFRFRNGWLQPPGTPDRRIHGATRLEFAADGRISLHRDYWDAAEEFYETLPAIGALMRRLRRAAAAG